MIRATFTWLPSLSFSFHFYNFTWLGPCRLLWHHNTIGLISSKFTIRATFSVRDFSVWLHDIGLAIKRITVQCTCIKRHSIAAAGERTWIARFRGTHAHTISPQRRPSICYNLPFFNIWIEYLYFFFSLVISSALRPLHLQKCNLPFWKWHNLSVEMK